MMSRFNSIGLMTAAIIAVSTAFSLPANANAGQVDSISGANFVTQIAFEDFGLTIQVGPRHGYGGRYDRHGGHGRYDNRHRGGRSYRAGICTPGEAVHKARRHGMYRAGVHRVLPRSVVVTGWKRGHRAKMVFDRTSRHCRVIGSRGI